MLIGITGHKFSGKSTVAGMLSELLGYPVVSFADKLKDVCCVLSGCTREQLEDYDFKENELVPDYLIPYCSKWHTPTYRSFLQNFGSEIMRSYNNNIWIDATLTKCGENTIISDCRFPNEAAAVTARGGIIIRVLRNSVSEDTHQSEKMVNEIVPDITIDNNGDLQDLYQQVVEIARGIKNVVQ